MRIFTIMIYAIFSVLHNGFSQPLHLAELKNGYDYVDEIKKCYDGIAEVFNVKVDVLSHAKHAIQNLELRTKMNVYAMSYYNSFYSHLIPGKIQSVVDYCSTEYFDINEQLRCSRALVDLFKGAVLLNGGTKFNTSNATESVTTAFYFLTFDKDINSSNSIDVRKYFNIILNGVQLYPVPTYINPYGLKPPKLFCIYYANKKVPLIEDTKPDRKKLKKGSSSKHPDPNDNC